MVNKNNKLYKFIFIYGLHVWLVLVIANIAALYAFNFYIHASSCVDTCVIVADVANPTTVPTVTPILTSTPYPTPTVVSNATQMKLTLLLHGRGNGGDSANASGKGNAVPIHPQQAVTIEIFNNVNVNVGTVNGTVTYDTVSGNYQGTIAVGNLATGLYSLRVRVNNYLRKLIPGIQSLTVGKINTIPPTALIAGDSDGDNVVTVLDYNVLMDCYSDLLPAASCDAAKKLKSDLDDDGFVNQKDYNLLFRELTYRSGD